MSALISQQEYRALDVLDLVPEGCVAHLDRDGCCFPMRYSNGHTCVLQLRPRRPNGHWWFGPMRTSLTFAASDGPYDDEEYLRSKMLGRVIGVISSTGGDL